MSESIRGATIHLSAERARFAKPYQNPVYKDGIAPVGSYAKGASSFGVFDLAGNASEWVADWYSESFQRAEARNPKEPEGGTGKVLRGGGWYDPRGTDHGDSTHVCESGQSRRRHRISLCPGLKVAERIWRTLRFIPSCLPTATTSVSSASVMFYCTQMRSCLGLFSCPRLKFQICWICQTICAAWLSMRPRCWPVS